MKFINRPADFNGKNYLMVSQLQAESLRFGEEFHYYKGHEFAKYMEKALKEDCVVEGCDLYFEEDGYLFRLLRPSYLSILLVVFEKI